MASVSDMKLPHATIPTQTIGNANLRNAVMYCNENFAQLLSFAQTAQQSINDAPSTYAAADHAHDGSYAASSHTHEQSEINGLPSALDGKADLNHEHSQYLTQLPTHYHDSSQVNGLQEQISNRAEKVHSHDMRQVNGLLSELSNKATTAYVDGKVAQIPMVETSAGTPTTVSLYRPESEEPIEPMPDETTKEQDVKVLWSAGGANGASLMIFYAAEEDGVAGHDLHACKVTISKGGLIVKIETTDKNSGINVVA